MSDLFAVSGGGQLSLSQPHQSCESVALHPNAFGDHLVGKPGIAHPQRSRIAQRESIKSGIAQISMCSHNDKTAPRDATERRWSTTRLYQITPRFHHAAGCANGPTGAGPTTAVLMTWRGEMVL